MIYFDHNIHIDYSCYQIYQGFINNNRDNRSKMLYQIVIILIFVRHQFFIFKM